MRKTRFFSLLGFVTLLLLAPMLRPTQKVKAGFYIEYYTVRYKCVISPDCWGCVEGQWTRDCDGQMTGWGWEPGTDCTYTEITDGDECIL
jgi:hypothetical protein